MSSSKQNKILIYSSAETDRIHQLPTTPYFNIGNETVYLCWWCAYNNCIFLSFQNWLQSSITTWIHQEWWPYTTYLRKWCSRSSSGFPTVTSSLQGQHVNSYTGSAKMITFSRRLCRQNSRILTKRIILKSSSALLSI